MEHFVDECEAKYPKATDCLVKDAEPLLTFFGFPAEHWRHLRTTNPIEAPFAGVKARTRQTKATGSSKAGPAMASESHRHKGNTPHLVALA